MSEIQFLNISFKYQALVFLKVSQVIWLGSQGREPCLKQQRLLGQVRSMAPAEMLAKKNQQEGWVRGTKPEWTGCQRPRALPI